MKGIRVQKVKMATQRTAVFFLMAVYLLLSVGIVKATHFCMGREASVTFFTGESKKCGCSLFAEEKEGCCDDTSELIRIDDDQKTISKLSLPMPVWKIERLIEEPVMVFTFRQGLSLERGERDPSPRPVPIWKSNCTFVFYDDERLT